MELVHKHQTKTGFDLDKIQKEFVAHFIAGKLPIDDCQTKLKMQFHYQLIPTEQSKMEHPTEYKNLIFCYIYFLHRLMLTRDHLLDDEDLKVTIMDYYIIMQLCRLKYLMKMMIF